MGTSTSPSTLDSNLSTGGTNSQTLADWAGPYVTDILGRTKAAAAEDYQTYGGPLTAGQSALQKNAFKGLAGLTVPKGIKSAANKAGNIASDLDDLSYQATKFKNQYSPVSSTFDKTQAKAYMSPYLMAALNPQIEEARRQAEITQQQNNAKAVQAGAFGGSRGALMNAETQRNLGTNLANITGQGYNTAYDKAMAQFNADQARKVQEAQLQAQYGLSAQQASELSKQFGANYDVSSLQAALAAAQAQANLANLQNSTSLANLNAQLSGGATQRGITAEGIAADKAEFEKQRQYPQEQLKFEKEMLGGLPISAVTNTPGQMTDLGTLLAVLGGTGALASAGGYANTADLLKDLFKTGTGAAGTVSDVAGTATDWLKKIFG
jgi:hypothetical protein